MIIDCISDLHGFYPQLEGGDLLIVGGDLTARDTENEHTFFDYWINEQNYKKKIVIAGNHDNVLMQQRLKLQFCDYLCDSGLEFEDLKIWGSPWTQKFPGMNPHCKAFTLNTEEELAEKWALIPEDTDILITHSPPLNILDKTIDGRHVGSSTLADKKFNKIKCPQLWVWGHIHESHGQAGRLVNASYVNERYQPVNKPIRVNL